MNVYPLEVQFSFNGKSDALYPALIQTNKELLLVDCGYEGFMALIEKAAQKIGFSLNELTAIIVSHHDMDHMGGLYELKVRYPHLKIFSSATEAPYIDGREKSLRLQQAEQLYASLPEEQKPGALYFQQMLQKVRPVKVDYTFQESNDPFFINTLQIVHTPGHMPGHISIYLPTLKTLIAADAVVYQEGELEIANPAFTLDLPAAIESVRKLQHFEIETLICYHGGIVQQEVQQKLTMLLQKYANE